ncbi:DUF1295-domain-containing protein [Durotheca rogersii]|uniref:DUF1295-domain-containing protein n=1 Tax=Durotheca rogersii TaxID=419775 RepID=UPI00221F40CF|nr:DUF1295-domain-containing protein [Durotheca rogersii]KAI5862513.1 DUF1295-domain-containing protein [Durotheca rogersii]
MSEQSRVRSWFGGSKVDSAQDQPQEATPPGTAAEQDRYGNSFGGDKLPPVDRHAGMRLPEVSGAEQDRYEHWFGGDKLPSRADIEKRLPHTSGAEQDTYGRWFSHERAPPTTIIDSDPSLASSSEPRHYEIHFRPGPAHIIRPNSTASTLGLLEHAVLPSFCFHSGLGVIAYGIGRYTNRVDVKDIAWPSGQVANAWWSAIGIPVVYYGVPVLVAWETLTYNQKLLLAGVSAWGLRLLYRIVLRSLRRGSDDPRYETAARKQSDFWNKASLTTFLPDTLAQALISLPFTLSFRAPAVSTAVAVPLPEGSTISHSLAVFLFTTGYALEALADSQLEAHSRKAKNEISTSGVWSIVRHPNYLGDALCHLSFPFLLYSAGQLHPLTLVGPVANYVFLRFIRGDRENEKNQEKRYSRENPVKYQELQQYKSAKNSFWPGPAEIGNKWLWAVVAAGASAVVVERAALAYTRS